jgi:hypothetical protein
VEAGRRLALLEGDAKVAEEVGAPEEDIVDLGEERVENERRPPAGEPAFASTARASPTRSSSRSSSAAIRHGSIVALAPLSTTPATSIAASRARRTTVTSGARPAR